MPHCWYYLDYAVWGLDYILYCLVEFNSVNPHSASGRCPFLEKPQREKYTPQRGTWQLYQVCHVNRNTVRVCPSHRDAVPYKKNNTVISSQLLPFIKTPGHHDSVISFWLCLFCHHMEDSVQIFVKPTKS